MHLKDLGRLGRRQKRAGKESHKRAEAGFPAGPTEARQLKPREGAEGEDRRPAQALRASDRTLQAECRAPGILREAAHETTFLWYSAQNAKPESSL